jgi:hypothetical protein
VSRERHTHMTSFRFSEREWEEYGAKAAAKGWTLSKWIRERLRGEPADSSVRYVSANHRAGVSISLTNDNRWQTWVHGRWWTPARAHPGCCKAGHERLEDAIDHGVSILRGDLLAEKETWPADSLGALILAGKAPVPSPKEQTPG